MTDVNRLSLTDAVAINGIRVNAPVTGQEFYVDSNLGGTSFRNGKAPDAAFLDTATALVQCVANKNDTIYLMPGHVESIGATALSWNVAGVNIVGLGHGASRPRFDYDNAASSIDIGASDITVRNITLRPSVTDVLVGIDVETLFVNTLLEDIEALPGEDGAGVDDFALVIDIKVGCTNTIIRRLKVRQHASGAGYIAGIRFTGASDDCLIDGCDIDILGAGVIACINGLTTLSTKLRIRNCLLTTDAEPGIELLTGTTGSIELVNIFANLATIDAATVADGMAHFECYYVDSGNEAGALIKTPSADD